MVTIRHVGMGISDKWEVFSSFYSHRFEQEAQKATTGHVIPYYTEASYREESPPRFAQEGWVKRVKVILNNFQGPWVVSAWVPGS